MGKDKDAIRQHFNGRWHEYYAPFVKGMRQAARDEYRALCPFHDDGNPSLSINAGNGVYFCHGCGAGGDQFNFYANVHKLDPERDFPKVIAGILRHFNLDAGGPRIVKAYPYHDENGNLLFEVVRFDPKDFRQRRPDGKGGFEWNLRGVRRVLYRLPEVLKADVVFIVEGEKDADALAALGFTATTNPGGAGKWRDEYNELLRGKVAILIPDNDEPGREHMQAVARSLNGIARAVYIADIKGQGDKGDISDFLARVPGAAEQIGSFIQGIRDRQHVEGIEKEYKNISFFSYTQSHDFCDRSGGAENRQKKNENEKVDDSGPCDHEEKSHKKSQIRSQAELSENQRVKAEYEETDAPLYFREVAAATGLRPERVKAACHYLKKQGFLEDVPGRPGWYRRVLRNLGYVDYKNINRDEEPIPFWFPAGLHQYVKLYPGALVVVAGESGAGKTTFALNICRRIDAAAEVIYINSELTPEWDAKLASFETEPDESLFRLRQDWKFKLKNIEGVPAEEVYRHIEPDKVNVVDWLLLGTKAEDFVSVTRILGNIKEAVKNGVVLVLMQKNRGQVLAQGKDQSLFLSSLYIVLLKHEGTDVRTMKIEKVRNLADPRKNPEGMAVDYQIIRGTKLRFEGTFHFDDRLQSSTSLPFPSRKF